MNNSPKVAAFNSYYQQAKTLYASGDLAGAREMFLKAASAANDISVTSTAYDVRMEYHRLAVQMLDFAKNKCVRQPATSGASSKGGSQSTSGDPDQKSFTAEKPSKAITFKDVAGLDDVKDQVIFHVLEPMRNPELAKAYGINPGGKLLLYGPPGTGKTFIARAIAGEVEAAFYAINCQDLISKYMGDSSKQLDKLFDEAQKNEKAIIFFDEFDSVASKRGDGTGGVDAEMSRFVATFLTKVDGFKKSETCKMLLLIAATTRPWALDSAMLRGGRFDTQIYIGVPDQKAREFMVNKAMKNLPLDPDVNLSAIAKSLEGFGGGDIVAACDKIRLEAYKKSVRLGKKQNITRQDCNLILSSIRNNTSAEEMAKFEAYRQGLEVT